MALPAIFGSSLSRNRHSGTKGRRGRVYDCARCVVSRCTSCVLPREVKLRDRKSQGRQCLKKKVHIESVFKGAQECKRKSKQRGIYGSQNGSLEAFRMRDIAW